MNEILGENAEFKDSAVGKIPKDWDCLTINDCLKNFLIIDVQDGNHGESHPKTEDFVNEGIPFVMAKDLINGQINIAYCNKITWKQYKSLRVGFACPGDVLLSHKGTIGLTAVVPLWLQDVMLTPQVTYYRVVKDSKLFNKFLFWFFQLPIFQQKLQILSAQSTRSYIGITLQKTLSISLPSSISEQQKIAKILDTLEKAIALTQTHINKLKQAKAGLLHDLLTKGIDEHGELRNPKRNPEQFKDSPLGKIPKDWEVKPLESICSEIVDCPHTTPVFRSEGVIIARTSNIRNGIFNISDVSYISEDDYIQRISRLKPQPGDVIFTREAPVGEAFVIPKKMRVCLGQRTMLLRPNPDKAVGEYIIAQVYSEIIKTRINQITGGTTNPHLNVSDVRTFKVPFPKVCEQKKITNILKKQDFYIQQKVKLIEKLKLVKLGLMSDLLTGKVRVKI